MMRGIPAASDPAESLADWLELEAIRDPQSGASLESLVRVIRRSGSTDAIEEGRGDAGSEVSQSIAQDAFSEIETRSTACGLKGGYPFEVSSGFLRLRKKGKSSPYVLLLLLSKTTPTGGYEGTARLFERICSHAARQYFGGPTYGADAMNFGSPRRAPYAKLCQAIDNLCVRLGEGGGCSAPDLANHTGDNGLDLVAWRNFPDRSAGKLIAFGQCAAGESRWPDKLTELDGRKFVQKWFRQPLVVEPIRLFFIPRRVSSDDWEHAGIDGGIVFDRCRIVSCLEELDNNLAQDCEVTSNKLIDKVFKK